MTYETIVAAFDTPDHARAAAKALKAEGFHSNDVNVLDSEWLARTAGSARELKEPGFWRRLFGGGMHEHEAGVFGQTIGRGGAIVSVRVLDSEVAHAIGVLDVHRPIDIHDRAVTSGLASAAKVDAAKKRAMVRLSAPQRIATSPKAAAVHNDVIRLAEEQLNVGKEMVETGRTRVRRYTTERDVAKDISLHDEHAEVLRRAVAEPASFKNVDWSDREMEVVETAEHALANKTARIVEEIELKKVGTDHIETIHDRLRRQQAEVVRTDARGKPTAPPPA